MEVQINSKFDVLFVYGEQAKTVTFTENSKTYEDIYNIFVNLFPNQINPFGSYVIQRYNSEWQRWLDCDKTSGICIVDQMQLNLAKKKCDIKQIGNLSTSTCAFLCCDMQERFKPAIQCFNEITVICGRLISAANILNIPLIVTEQYPKGLLHTVSELDISKAKAVVAKTKFSMAVPEVLEALSKSVPDLKSIVLFGVEAHVCIQQTALDFLAQGIEVHIAADGCSSRTQVDRALAYERLKQQGAVITTAESILLQLVGDKDHPSFKQVQGLIKELAPNTGLLKSHI